MNRWTAVNLSLAGIAAALLVVAAWPTSPTAAVRLTGLEAAAIASVRVESGDRLTLALRRDTDHWRLEHPIDAPANARRVAQLLAIAQAPLRRDLHGRADLQAYGLDPPAVVLELDATRVAFGDLDPTQRLRYVAVGDRVGAIDDVFYHLLTLPARHFAGPGRSE